MPPHEAPASTGAGHDPRGTHALRPNAEQHSCIALQVIPPHEPAPASPPPRHGIELARHTCPRGVLQHCWSAPQIALPHMRGLPASVTVPGGHDAPAGIQLREASQQVVPGPQRAAAQKLPPASSTGSPASKGGGMSASIVLVPPSTRAPLSALGTERSVVAPSVSVPLVEAPHALATTAAAPSAILPKLHRCSLLFMARRIFQPRARTEGSHAKSQRGGPAPSGRAPRVAPHSRTRHDDLCDSERPFIDPDRHLS
jgi:hypothetical protein